MSEKTLKYSKLSDEGFTKEFTLSVGTTKDGPWQIAVQQTLGKKLSFSYLVTKSLTLLRNKNLFGFFSNTLRI